MPESIIVQKILRPLPSRFNPKVSAIEETADCETLTMNQLLGNLTAYEMRLPQKKPSTREATFKTEKKKGEERDVCSCSDEEEEFFFKKLDRGSGKYKGKLPFKCFNCGRVGHYATKCPHKKVRSQAQESEKTHQRTGRKERNSAENPFMITKTAMHLKTQMNPQVKKEPQNFY